MKQRFSVRRTLLLMWIILAFPGGFFTCLALKHHFEKQELVSHTASLLARVTAQRDALAFGEMGQLQRMLDESAAEKSYILKSIYMQDPTALKDALGMIAGDRYSYRDEKTAGKLRGLLDWLPTAGLSGRVDFENKFLGSNEIAPELSVRKWIGEERPLKTLRGKVVLLDFWGTWCGPCIKAFPHVQSLYDKYKASGFEVIAIHLPAKAETAEAFLKDKPYTFAVALDAGHTGKDYGVNAAPTYCLIGRDGRIAWAPNPLLPTYQHITEEQFEAEMKDAIEKALAM